MLLPHLTDTIAAIASAPGPAVRGIVRISGPNLLELLERLRGEAFRPVPLPPPNDQAISPDSTESDSDAPVIPLGNAPQCVACSVPLLGTNTTHLPCELYLWRTRRSYTGEPLAELHTIGSPPLLDLLLRTVLAHGARLAQPGEFTLRAFLAGRLDLTQAEAVLGVIDARDVRELQVALDQLAGGLSSRIVPLRGELLDLLADLEAGLDFAHEALEFVSHAQLVARLQHAREVVDELLLHASERALPNRLPRVVLVGPPNAGKSTLFNALANRDLALVSPERGTTRDYLSAEVTWNGATLTLIDTAGWDAPQSGIDAQAQLQRTAQVASADIIVQCHAADDPTVGQMSNIPGHTAQLDIHTKADLSTAAASCLSVSALTGHGLDELKSRIVELLASQSGHEGDWVATTAVRGRNSLNQAAAALERALNLAEAEQDQAVLAIEIRDALDELGSIVGAVYTDDILDRVFSRFCIGK